MQQQYEVYAAGTGDEALQQLRRHRIALMLCDIRMPGTSGVDLVPQAIEIEPELAILMLTAVNDATSAALCMQRGAMDYLTKPIELADLGRAVQRALKRREMLLENRHLNQWLKEEVTTRSAELQRERAKLERISVATLEALVNALEAKDPYMRGHSARVADLSATIAAELGMSEEQVEHVRVAGRLHDIGKIGTREAVLNKQGALSPEEFEHVKQHVVIGSQILAPLPHLEHIIAMVRSHHERWDGTGYPDGLRSEEIPLGGRVIATAEVYDALCTSRPYQEKLTPEQTVERMADLAGTVLDPKVFEALSAGGGRRPTPAVLHAGTSRQPEWARPPAARDPCRPRTPGVRGAPSRRDHRRARAPDLRGRPRRGHRDGARRGPGGRRATLRSHERRGRAPRGGSDALSPDQVAGRGPGPSLGVAVRHPPPVPHQRPGERPHPDARAAAPRIARDSRVRGRTLPPPAGLDRRRRARVRARRRARRADRPVRARRTGGADLRGFRARGRARCRPLPAAREIGRAHV